MTSVDPKLFAHENPPDDCRSLLPETLVPTTRGHMKARAPFEVFGEQVGGSPLIFASPHSGRYYPEAMMQAAALDSDAIRRSEDVLVDNLVSGARDLNVPLLAASYARAFIDVNREPYELDQAMFSDKLPAYASIRTARVAAGLGSIARVVAEGQEIYREKLVFADARERIEGVHRPYHERLQELILAAVTTFGVAILIDWHSMPSAAAGGDGRHAAPDIVLGDRFGASCAPLLIEFVQRELERRGYRVARNVPYAGGYTTEFYGRPLKSVHALQIELNRKLYLNEATLKPHDGFEKLKENLGEVIRSLTEWNWKSLT